MLSTKGRMNLVKMMNKISWIVAMGLSLVGGFSLMACNDENKSAESAAKPEYERSETLYIGAAATQDRRMHLAIWICPGEQHSTTTHDGFIRSSCSIHCIPLLS